MLQNEPRMVDGRSRRPDAIVTFVSTFCTNQFWPQHSGDLELYCGQMSAPDPAPLQLLGLSPADVPAPPPSAEALQFQRAEYAGTGPGCGFCKKSAGPSHYQVGQAVACPACAETAARDADPARPEPDGARNSLRSGRGFRRLRDLCVDLTHRVSILDRSDPGGRHGGESDRACHQRAHQPCLPGAGRRADLRRDHHKLPADDDLGRH